VLKSLLNLSVNQEPPVLGCKAMRTLTFNRVIGSGAMGTVYQAELRVPSGGFTRQCAVKVLKSGSPDDEPFRARMRDEARLLGMLQDEHILGVSDLVRVEGRDAVVMEYVEGVDLSDLLSAGPVPARALAELIAVLGGTLFRAHTAKEPTTGEPLEVIHRDVKPANVMLTVRGSVRILDFGVARAAFATRESKTQGLVLGTLNYFPPEVLSGFDPTPAVDIYGLGLTLWECAAGKNWGSPDVAQGKFEAKVEQRLLQMGASYRELVPVLRKMLAWHPSERPTGAEVEQMLLTVAEGCTGKGLRGWAGDTVSPLLKKRVNLVDSKVDELVGRTFVIGDDGESRGEVGSTAVQLSAQNIPRDTQGISPIIWVFMASVIVGLGMGAVGLVLLFAGLLFFGVI
jgi:serine/threonine protein kinase